jgi:sterol desaturase/sphingolipid hydroxylase (fatty acid hydroxylase superfamily)
MSLMAVNVGPASPMEINPVAFAIPIFLIAILVEAWISRRQRDRADEGEAYYFFGTALSDVTVGTVFQGVEVLFNILTFGAYVWLFDNFNLVDWGDASWAKWAVALLGVDLMFYWWHRASHVVNFLWAVHGVHHQSEDFNLAVALRQPLFEPITWFFFYAPLALLGIDPMTYLGAYAINRFYQFWIHTELVDKLGPLEWVLNTPSHHRVHHGVQEQYLDKNYGAILIIWDRLFASFEPEEERVIYGTTVPLRSYNPVWANFAIFARIGRLMRVASSPLQWAWAPFAHPAWLPGSDDPDAHLPKRQQSAKYRPKASPAAIAYVAAHFLALGGFMFIFLLRESQWSFPQLCLGASVIVSASMAFTGILEARIWAWPLEILRLLGLIAAIYWLGSTHYPVTLAGMATAAMAAGSLVGLLLFRARRGDDRSASTSAEEASSSHQARAD